MKSEFIHLHNHSDNSLLDGAQNIPSVLETITDLGMDSVALTEHGNLFGAVSFYKKAKEKKQLISPETSKQINNILRKVVTEKEGTASLADIYGYDVGGKTGIYEGKEMRNPDVTNDPNGIVFADPEKLLELPPPLDATSPGINA